MQHVLRKWPSVPNTSLRGSTNRASKSNSKNTNMSKSLNTLHLCSLNVLELTLSCTISYQKRARFVVGKQFQPLFHGCNYAKDNRIAPKYIHSCIVLGWSSNYVYQELFPFISGILYETAIFTNHFQCCYHNVNIRWHYVSIRIVVCVPRWLTIHK